MSDISVLSREYHISSEFAQSFSNALILIKKFQKKLPGSEKISVDELNVTSRRLAIILLELVTRLAKPSNGIRAETGKVVIPGSLIVQLRHEWRGELDYYLDDLKKIAQKLNKNIVDISDDELNMLDRIAAVADAETSRVFRRLTRK